MEIEETEKPQFQVPPPKQENEDGENDEEPFDIESLIKPLSKEEQSKKLLDLIKQFRSNPHDI